MDFVLQRHIGIKIPVQITPAVVKVAVKVAAVGVGHPVPVVAVAARKAVEVKVSMALLHLQKPHKAQTELQHSV